MEVSRLLGGWRQLRLASRSAGSFDGDVLIHDLHGWLNEGFTVCVTVPTVRTESSGNDMST